MTASITNDFFVYLFDLFKSLPVLLQIVIGLFIVIIVLTSGAGFKRLFKKILKLSVTKNKKIRRKVELYDHDLFVKQPQYIRIARNSEFGHPIKTKVFHIILFTTINTIIFKAKEFVKNNDINKISSLHYRQLLYLHVQDIVSTYNKLIKNQFKIQYGEEKGKEIFDFVMNSAPNPIFNKIGGFNIWHERRTSEIEEFIDLICKSKAFDSNIERHELYQHELNRACYMSINDAIKVYQNFNGELNKILNI
ncbi:MAG: hypothetical protein WCT85_00640 [Parachlamydiales bacterium]|jgi:hypothetical protein